MNEKQRFIFIAYYVERDGSKKEIAKELQMSQQAVAKCLKKNDYGTQQSNGRFQS